MLKEPNHNATRGEFNKWAAEIRLKLGVSQIDYSKVTNEEIIALHLPSKNIPTCSKFRTYQLFFTRHALVNGAR
jgi:hypothetical protein